MQPGRDIDERRAYASALIAVLLWSTVATGFELGLRRYAPVQLLLLGSGVALVFFASAIAIRAARGGPSALASTPRGRLLRCALLGLANPFAYYLILLAAYDRLPAQIAQPLNYTWAITLALLAVPVLGQRLAARQVVGMLVSYGGVVVLLTGGDAGDAEGVDGVGVALALASTLVWSGYWLASAALHVDALVQLSVGFAAGTLAIGVACVLGPGLPAVDGAALGFGAWVGLLEMGLPFLLWQRAMTLTRSAGRISQLIFLSPFLSLVLIQNVVGEDVRASSVAGLAGIVLGLVVSGRADAGGDPGAGEPEGRAAP